MRKNMVFYLVVLVFSLFVYSQTQKELNYHLFEAVKFGNLQQVKILVERGADVNARDVNDITVLMCAAANGNMDIVKYFISKGASLNLKDTSGRTALYHAASRNRVEITKFLIKLCAVPGKNEEEYVLRRILYGKGEEDLEYRLFKNIEAGNLKVIKTLLDKGANVNAKDPNEVSVLMWAAYNGHLDIVKYLLSKGASLKLKDTKGRTVLYYGTIGKNIKIAEFLMKKGVVPSKAEKEYVLGQMGGLYHQKGVNEENYEKSSKIDHVIKKPSKEATSPGNIDYVDYSRGDFKNVLEYYHNAPQKILEVYRSKGEKGLRDFVKDKNKTVNKYLINEFCESGVKKRNKEKLKIALVLAEELSDKRILSYAQYRMGEYFLSIGNFGKMIYYFEKAFPVLEKMNDPKIQKYMKIFKKLIDVFKKNDLISELRKFCDEELSLFEEEGDLRFHGQIYMGKGMSYIITGDNINGFKMLEKALSLYEKEGDLEGVGKVHMNKGNFYTHIRDYGRALEMYEKALPFFEKAGNLEAQGEIYKNKGDIYQYTGDNSRALEMYEKVLPFYENTGDFKAQGEIYKNKGDIYQYTGDNSKAHDMYNRALVLFERAVDSIGIGSVHEVKGDIYFINDEYSNAIKMYEKALSFYKKSYNFIGQESVYDKQGYIHLLRGDYSKALYIYEKALPLQKKIGVIEFLSSTLHRKAQALAKLGKTYEALSFFEEAINKLEKFRRQAAFPWIKMAFMEKVYEQYTETIIFMLENKYYDHGFKYAESGKARVFLDKLAEGLVKLEKGINQELLQKRDGLVAKLSLLSKEINIAAQKKNEEKLKKLKNEYQKTEFEFEDLLVKIRLENPLYASVQYPEPVTLNHLQQNILKKEEILLQYFVSSENVYVFLVSKKDFQVVSLPVTGKEINKMVDDYLEPFKKKVYLRKRNKPIVKRWMINHGKIFYESLFKRLEPELWGIKDIIIIPDGKLSTIPFESFVVDKKSTNEPVYLLEKYRIKYIQSASVLETLRKHYRSEGKSAHFIGFGDPVYDYENFKQGKPEHGTPEPVKGDEIKEIHRGKYAREGGMFNRLPGSGQEVETIAGLFKNKNHKGTVFLREQASEENAKSLSMKGCDYIHFSCHGILGENFQSLILSQIPTSKEDGYLTLNELMNCDYNAKLVVLSACETGTGKMERAEGVTGLTRAVMYAGTPAVVASLWNVSDIGTKELMVNFYTNMLEKKMSKEEALRQAKLEMIKDGKYSSPYFWSAFLMYGE